MAAKPPALVPVSETHLRRHVTDNWPQHAVSCEFYREPAEQVEISASYRPLPQRRVRLLRSFDVSPAAPLSGARHRRRRIAGRSWPACWCGC